MFRKVFALEVIRIYRYESSYRGGKREGRRAKSKEVVAAINVLDCTLSALSDLCFGKSSYGGGGPEALYITVIQAKPNIKDKSICEDEKSGRRKRDLAYAICIIINARTLFQNVSTSIIFI